MPRLRITVLAVVTGLSLATQSVHAADSPAEGPLAPATNWNLDYGLESCRLGRTFGQGDAAVTLYMQQSRPGDFFEMTLAGERFGKPRRAFGTKAHFGSLEERKFDESIWIGQATDGRPVLLMGINTFAEWDDEAKTWISPSAEALKGIDRLEFEVPRLDHFTLASGPMDAPMNAMKACFADLMTTWGFDLATYESLARQPEPLANPGEWIGSLSYPENLMRDGQGAMLSLRLVVSEEGVVENCFVQNNVGDAEFGAIACKQLVDRRLFRPALGKSNTPVRTLWFSNVRFQA